MSLYKTKKKIQQEEEDKVRLFLEEYRALVDKHGFDFKLTLDYTTEGIRPRAKIIKKQIAEEKTNETTEEVKSS